jgi:hypothetical protein
VPLDKDALKSLLKEGGERVYSILVDRVEEFVDGPDLQAHQAFIKERADRLFELGVERAKATTDDERDSIDSSIGTVTDAITSELWSAAVDTSAATRSTIRSIVGAVKDFVLEVLPVAAKILIAAV